MRGRRIEGSCVHIWEAIKEEETETRKGRASKSVSFCICQRWLASTTPHVVPLHCLLHCSNQSDLKLWLMPILSRHGEPIFLSLSGRYGFVVVQIAVVVADHPRATT